MKVKPGTTGDYRAHYVRLGGERRRLTGFDPLGAGLAAADMGVPGGMADAGHAAGGPSRRELELAAWLTADVPENLKGAQFDIATLLAAVAEFRYFDELATRNMLDAEHRAYEAEQRARDAEQAGPLGELASRYATLKLAAVALERQNAEFRAALDLCQREHLGIPAVADGGG